MSVKQTQPKRRGAVEPIDLKLARLDLMQRFSDAIVSPGAVEMRRDYYGWFLPALTDAQLRQLAPRRIRELCDTLGVTGNVSADGWTDEVETVRRRQAEHASTDNERSG